MPDPAWLTSFAALCIFCVAATCHGALPGNDPLRGEYGFLTDYAGLTEAEARTRVRQMNQDFGILEFQLYDAVEGYSRPPDPSKDSWSNSAFGRPVQRGLLRAYTDEIKLLGGRAWLYVQAVGTDPGDIALQDGFKVVGQHTVDGRPLLDVILPNAAWASRIAGQWAAFAASLGCAGIHWDTLGDWGGGSVQDLLSKGTGEGFLRVAFPLASSSARAYMQGFLPEASAGGADIPGFLRAAAPLLANYSVAGRSLAQTLNFVDGFGWDHTLFQRLTGPGGWHLNTVAFPYWEVWTVPSVELRFFSEVDSIGGGVFACYPGKDGPEVGRQNSLLKDFVPMERLKMRWRRARCRGSAFLVVGNGHQRIQNEYFPDTAPLTAEEVESIRHDVFDSPCTIEADGETRAASHFAWQARCLCVLVGLFFAAEL